MEPRPATIRRIVGSAPPPAAAPQAIESLWPEAVSAKVEADEAEPPPAADPVPAAGVAVALDEAQLAALIARIVYQDEAAFAELYRCLAGRIWRHVRRFVADLGTAEEVVEDVFWQAWRQAPRFDPARGNALAWMLQIARSRAIDALRAAARNPLHAADDVDDPLHTTASDADDPSQRLGTAQFGTRLDAALRELDPLRRQLVALAFLRGWSQAEIAEHTGLPLGTVKSHIRRALAALKHTLDPSTPEATR